MSVRRNAANVMAVVSMLALSACTPGPPDKQATESPVVARTQGSGNDTTATSSVDVDDLAEAATVRIEGTSCDAEWVGSGFVVDLDGTGAGSPVVVTNRHVVEGSSSLELLSTAGVELAVTDVVQLRFADLAIITVDGEVPESLALAPTQAVAGDHVRAFGYPGGGAFDRKTGTVVGYTTDPDLGGTDDVMRLDVWVRPGNSGGPVLDMNGDVVGVVYAIELATRYGLAIPADVLGRLARDPSAGREVVACE